MIKPFNENSGPRAHHYILKLSLNAGVDNKENPQDKGKPAFMQAVLFLNRLKKWAEKHGAANMKTEALPATDDGFPRIRLACPPALLKDIRDSFPFRISRVDEIPLPRPPKKSLWKKIFGG